MLNSTGHATRDISFASSVHTRSGRALVRLLESATGRIGLIRRARGYEIEIGDGTPFWSVMPKRYGVNLKVIKGSLDMIPRTGPLLVLANHPYGILDGLMLGHILDRTRGDFRILANSVFDRAEDVRKVILPVDFDGTPEALRTNLATRKAALTYLREGGAMGIFPGGTVSTPRHPFGRAMDPGWRTFAAKLISRSSARVVPIFFEGSNSRLFQIASHVHPTLRLALLINEFRRRTDTPVRVAIGTPLPRREIDQFLSDPQGMMEYLRRQTYALAPNAAPPFDLGYEFEDKQRSNKNDNAANWRLY